MSKRDNERLEQIRSLPFGDWFNRDTGLKYQVINVIRNNVFVRDYKGDVAYESLDIFIANYQKFKG